MTSEKILIVDDISSNRKLLAKMLQTIRQCEVIEAIDGQKAVIEFKDQSPDLILMDINMPEMNGRESAAEIKKLAKENYTPIIFVTALTDEASISSALDSGGDDFISKPVDVGVLNSKITAHLRIRELNKQINDKNRQLERLNKNLIREQDLIEHFFEGALKQSFLNKELVRHHMSSMSVFNGDLLLTERGADGGLYMIVGDFTGHGLAAAMGTIPVAMIFFKMVKNGFAIGEIAREINSQLKKLMPSSMFLAANMLQLNANGDAVSLWTGGMPDHYYLKKTDQSIQAIKSMNMALGILQDEDFEAKTLDLQVDEGDKFYLYSDGITEARNHNNEMFGKPRLTALMESDSSDKFSLILEKLAQFTGLESQNDDITLVELTCRKVPPKNS